MTTYEKSAMIGFFRNGMTYQEIALLMGISVELVDKIIREHLKHKN